VCTHGARYALARRGANFNGPSASRYESHRAGVADKRGWDRGCLRGRGRVLRGILELRFGEHAIAEPAPDSESLELVIAA
jgi:hypothetical protein